MKLKDTTDSIVAVHHSFLRRELPHVSELLEALPVHPEMDAQPLREAQQLFTKVRTKIEAHLRDEETVLFPTGIALDEGTPPPLPGMDLPARLREMELEHDNCGKALGTLENMLIGLSNSNAKEAALEALRNLRADLDVHVEKENTLVHPRLFELLSAHQASLAAAI